VLFFLRRGGENLEMLIFSLRRPMSFCVRFFGVLILSVDAKFAAFIDPAANGSWTLGSVRV
jgi:hypothetical protein